MEDQEKLFGTMENQELERVGKLEARMKGIMTSPAINGGMDTKERRQFC